MAGDLQEAADHVLYRLLVIDDQDRPPRRALGLQDVARLEGEPAEVRLDRRYHARQVQPDRGAVPWGGGVPSPPASSSQEAAAARVASRAFRARLTRACCS